MKDTFRLETRRFILVQNEQFQPALKRFGAT